MDHLLLLVMLLVCSSGLQAEGELNSTEPGVRLVGGESRCAGALELEHQGEWRPVGSYNSLWTLKAAGVVCRELDCGSAVSVGRREESSKRDVWGINYNCVESGSALRECAASSYSPYFLNLTCSDSVRLLGGTALCSGRLEVNSDPSDPSWSSVCEADFDQQDAQVVCRQLGCGAPSVLQGALYGEGEAPMGTKEFQCGGHESALLDCSSASERSTCSPGTAVSLTCSEPGGVQLVGGESRCAGALELEHQGEWRPVEDYSLWTLKAAGVVCRELDCGSAVSVGLRVESSQRDVWVIRSLCVESGSALRECAGSLSSNSFLNLTCSDKLLQPNISVSSSMYGVSGAQQQGFQVFRGSTFSISCSIQPQYPGGSFLLSSSTHNYTQPAVNHSAHFLFPAAEPAHQGNYSCVYHVSASPQDSSSESRLLSVTVTGVPSDPEPFIIRAVVLLLTQLLVLLVTIGLYFYCKATRGRRLSRQEDIELDYDDLGVPAEEEGAQGAE
ncbi:scavenger receptor cysteine-rich type 1 protein M130-like [Gymnodraco acuticeps]|uniref:Scavenger receptor cysteine-rich type 1 protein M130-like n=1 Tax=Gymnodraco acuticeps TaxID=8218 RepID=A0A6P8SPL8_GYMAC|nr:scavenger receptor cysteine-rich type 1 protein M130-like [Gymnodraco acuticeps]